MKNMLEGNDLATAYPGAKNIIAIHEGFDREGAEAMIASARRWALENNKSPADVVEWLKFVADWSIVIVPGCRVTACRSEMDHPDFLKYVAAKMGGL